MKLHVLASSSKGNGYVLEGKSESLVIEAGLPFKSVQKALYFNTNSILGCVITHAHGDHAKYVREYLKRGIQCFMSNGSADVLGFNYSDVLKPSEVIPTRAFNIGSFKVMAFSAEHDCPGTVGYLIFHPEMGKLLFVTDTSELNYSFADINHAVVEANYVDEIVNDRIESGRLNHYMARRIEKSHSSLEACKKILRSCLMQHCYTIVLIHLSDSNSNEKQIQSEIYDEFNIPTYIAQPGLSINLVYDTPDF